MNFPQDQLMLRVQFDARQCTPRPDEIEKMADTLGPLDRLAASFPRRDLHISVERHPRTHSFDVTTSLQLPGRTLVSSEREDHLQPAFERCVNNLIEQLEAYQEDLGGAHETAKREKGTHQDVEPSAAPDAAALRAAADAGDYPQFRAQAAAFEDSLRRRTGRWVARYPKADGQVGSALLIDDLVEAVFLNAFEQFEHRPANVPFGDWLEGLIDGSLKEWLQNRDEMLDNVRFAQTSLDTGAPTSS